MDSFDLGKITGMGAPVRGDSPAATQLRNQTLYNRILLARNDALRISETLGALMEAPDQIPATERRELRLRGIEGDLASAKQAADGLLEDIARAP